MNRDEFKLRLAARLSALTDDERAEVFSFFDECLDEALEHGEDEGDALERLGSPDDVAAQLLAEREAKAPAQGQAADAVTAFETDGLRGVRVEARDAGIRVTPSESKTINVKYEAHRDEEFSIYVEDGVLVVRERLPQRWIYWLKNIFEFGWDSWRWTIELSLPANYSGFVDIASSNHAVSAEGLSVDSLSVRTSNSKAWVERIRAAGDVKVTSSNSMVSAQDCKVSGNVTIETTNSRAEAANVECLGELSVRSMNSRLSVVDCSAAAVRAKTLNGKVLMSRVTAENELSAHTSNASIAVDLVNAGKLIKLASANAPISGRIGGSASQYTVFTRTSNNKALPPSGGNGPVRLEATTSNGRIDLEFEKPYKLVFSDG